MILLLFMIHSMVADQNDHFGTLLELCNFLVGYICCWLLVLRYTWVKFEFVIWRGQDYHHRFACVY